MVGIIFGMLITSIFTLVLTGSIMGVLTGLLKLTIPNYGIWIIIILVFCTLLFLVVWISKDKKVIKLKDNNIIPEPCNDDHENTIKYETKYIYSESSEDYYKCTIRNQTEEIEYLNHKIFSLEERIKNIRSERNENRMG